MKFLCVPCDSPMKLQSVGPPERGSLSVVYSCPECGYEMAMLTNAFETQIVQSLGVRIGSESGETSSSRLHAEGTSASLADPLAEAGTSSSGPGCPFTAMIAGSESKGEPARASESIPVTWTAAAEARLAKVPDFVRPMARTGIERFARERGTLEVDEKVLDAAREFFGM
jgi:Proto-chlorophyllide reductase 57 kD subunit